MWRRILTEGHKPLAAMRWMFRGLPSAPRCKLCLSPFAGIGGRMVRPLGFRASRKNPFMCSRCLEELPAGGAEVDVAVLFADVRGSTQLGEGMEPAAYAGRMNSFYRTASDVLVKHDALIDKLIGDEVMALFVPGVAGKRYRELAVEAGVDLLEKLGGAEEAVPVGIGLHAGPAYVGNVGGEGIQDMTALGDTVNVAARLRSAADAGEMVISETTWSALAEPPAAEARVVQLKGKAEAVRVRVLRAPARA
jgi:adenylate cyclase